MKLLELKLISEDGRKSLTESFANLPETDHKDGKFRLRRYSATELRTTFWNAGVGVLIERLSHRIFTQSKELNKHQGGMNRDFEEIEEGVLNSEGMKEICLNFKQSNNLIDGEEVEIHQMRVATVNGEAEVAPEGWHQDGYKHIAMIGVNRHNITGGELLVRTDMSNDPFMCRILENGDMFMLDDSKMWHNANPIQAVNLNEQGFMDILVLCASKVK